jgi:hypothetical protein
MESSKTLEEKKREAVENLSKILKELKRSGEENPDNSENDEENSQIMQNDLIFTSAGELLNPTNKK